MHGINRSSHARVGQRPRKERGHRSLARPLGKHAARLFANRDLAVVIVKIWHKISYVWRRTEPLAPCAPLILFSSHAAKGAKRADQGDRQGDAAPKGDKLPECVSRASRKRVLTIGRLRRGVGIKRQRQLVFLLQLTARDGAKLLPRATKQIFHSILSVRTSRT